MKNDYSVFEKIPLQDIINSDELYSDTDTEKSDKEENYLSDEEFKNNYHASNLKPPRLIAEPNDEPSYSNY